MRFVPSLAQGNQEMPSGRALAYGRLRSTDTSTPLLLPLLLLLPTYYQYHFYYHFYCFGVTRKDGGKRNALSLLPIFSLV